MRKFLSLGRIEDKVDKVLSINLGVFFVVIFISKNIFVGVTIGNTLWKSAL